ncbi:MAG: hypothetical protein WAW17_15835 [Rhodococcus sp. (in: high G+C Gram-positive bacteria)]|uniref:hypothetical protein n=1 Tax=Rhodococcus sp. TaxID=1831 RepID=UPI003BB09E90
MSLSRRKVGLSSVAAPRAAVNVNVLNANLGTIETTLNNLVENVEEKDVLGYWQTPDFFTTDYTATAGLQTATETDVQSSRYRVVEGVLGKTLFWNLFVNTVTLTANASPIVKLPGGLVSAAYAYGFAHCNNAGVFALGMYNIIMDSDLVTISAGPLGTVFNLGVNNSGYAFSLVIPVK